jgi:hypothetical protein
MDPVYTQDLLGIYEIYWVYTGPVYYGYILRMYEIYLQYT